MEEPAVRRLAAAAAAPSRERRPPALDRGRPATPRASARAHILRREPPHKERAPRARRSGKGAGSGFAGPPVPERRQRPERNRAHRPTAAPEHPRGPVRLGAAPCPVAQRSGSVRHQPRSMSPGRCGASSPAERVWRDHRARHQGKAFPFQAHHVIAIVCTGRSEKAVRSRSLAATGRSARQSEPLDAEPSLPETLPSRLRADPPSLCERAPFAASWDHWRGTAHSAESERFDAYAAAESPSSRMEGFIGDLPSFVAAFCKSNHRSQDMLNSSFDPGAFRPHE